MRPLSLLIAALLLAVATPALAQDADATITWSCGGVAPAGTGSSFTCFDAFRFIPVGTWGVSASANTGLTGAGQIKVDIGFASATCLLVSGAGPCSVNAPGGPSGHYSMTATFSRTACALPCNWSGSITLTSQ